MQKSTNYDRRLFFLGFKLVKDPFEGIPSLLKLFSKFINRSFLLVFW